MPKIKDITGKRYKKLTVTSISPMKKTYGETYWECQCDCGNVVSLSKTSLRMGVTSCGYCGPTKKTGPKPKNTSNYKKQWRQKNLRKSQDYHFKYKFGISLAQVEFMYAQQLGKCAICQLQKPLGGRHGLHVDHDHKTGEVRGLLCNPCNMGLGAFKDASNNLLNAASYVILYSKGAPNEFIL